MPPGTLPNVQIDYSQGTINPEPNQSWFGPDGEIKYGTAIEKANFDATFGVPGSRKDKKGKDGASAKNDAPSGPADTKSSEPSAKKAPDIQKSDTAPGDSVKEESSDKTPVSDAAPPVENNADQSEVSAEQRALQAAYEKGEGVAGSLGGQAVNDTEKLLKTLAGPASGDKDTFLYGDVKNLNSNLEIAKVGEQLKLDGLWDGQLPITFVSAVEKTADGQYKLGKPVATFQGGRSEIAAILSDQMKYARRDRSQGGGGGGGESDASNDGRQGGDAKKEDAEARARAAADWEKGLKDFSKKNYSSDQYAEGWGRFLERTGMENSPLKSLAEGFGGELYSGRGAFDGNKLSALMAGVGQTDQQSVDAALAKVNQKLADSGLNIKASVNNETGLINAMEMTGVSAGLGQVSIRVDASGRVEASEGLNSSRKQAGLEHVSLRLAKQAEPDACP